MTDKEKIFHENLKAKLNAKGNLYDLLFEKFDLQIIPSRDYKISLAVDKRICEWIEEFKLPPKLPVVQRSPDFGNHSQSDLILRSEAQINAFITETQFQL